jgi:hypothetical protein
MLTFSFGLQLPTVTATIQQQTLTPTTMQVFKSLLSLFLILACLVAVSLGKKQEDEDQALKDLYAGLAGLKEAAQNPALLAQLMRDLQVSDAVVFAVVGFI